MRFGFAGMKLKMEIIAVTTRQTTQNMTCTTAKKRTNSFYSLNLSFNLSLELTLPKSSPCYFFKKKGINYSQILILERSEAPRRVNFHIN